MSQQKKSHTFEQLAIAEAALPSDEKAGTKSHNPKTSTRVVPYFKIATLVILLLTVVCSTAIPATSKVQLAESLSGALANQWQILALSMVSSNSTMIPAAPAL